MTTKLPEVIYRGSVKDVCGDPNQGDNGVYYFNYSDRYSVFDWGEMPDQLDHKGEALAIMADAFFRFLQNPENWQRWDIAEEIKAETRLELKKSKIFSLLKERGVTHHSLGLVDEN